jgi:DNA-binding GntR family transcriptional regulator
MKSLRKNPIVPSPLRLQALNGLRQAIIDGELVPGQRLREAELSEITGVSRSVIREALCQLESERLIVAVPNKGAVVGTLSAAEAADVYRIRGLLEGFAARLFVEHASDGLVARLVGAGDAIIAAYATGSVKTILKAKNRFYEILYTGSGSDVLQSLYGTLNARMSLWRAHGLSDHGEGGDKAARSVRDIQSIVAAIRRRDADAAEERVRERVRTSAQNALRAFEQPPPDRPLSARNSGKARARNARVAGDNAAGADQTTVLEGEGPRR